MHPVRAPAAVHGDGDRIERVAWRDELGRPCSYRIVRQIDAWSYVGHWWSNEIRREYQLLETDAGMWIELYREHGGWWVSRTNA
jgi:hypothetical protein